ncbi:MAG: hypothetical protein BWY05_01187 [Euryarchaeota archaeon ADurb.Bin165]|nr:MAG: hypothetical protein BWY05_01187 [Euryarchaeota archaeon ADurb.Bin165]
MITWLSNFFPWFIPIIFMWGGASESLFAKILKKPKRKARSIMQAITVITTMSNVPWDVDSAFSRRIGVRLVICH